MKLRAGDPLHEFVVQDDGPGLPMEASPEQGTGIGLELIESLTRQIHGERQVATGPGRNHRHHPLAVTTCLPRRKMLHSTAPPPKFNITPMLTRILIVEDEAVTALDLKRELTALGYEVWQASPTTPPTPSISPPA